MTRLEKWAPGLPWAVATITLGFWFARGGLLSDWMATQWYFSYELEFVRRGLPGSAARLVLGDPTPLQLTLVAVATSTLLGGALLAFGFWATRTRDPAFRICTALVLAACPATLSQFAADTGRFDHLNYLVTLAALLLLDRGQYAAAALLAGLGVLIHEGFLMLSLPVLIGAAAYVAVQRGESLARAVPLIIVGVASFGWTEIAGNLESVSRDDFVADLVCRHGLDPEYAYSSAASLYRNLGSKVARHSARLLPNLGSVALYLGVSIAALGPYLWIAFRLISVPLRRFAARRRVVLAAVAASPLFAASMLIVGGADWSRWIGFLVVNSLVIALFVLRREPEVVLSFPLSLRATAALVVVSLAVGPLGELRAFPYSFDVRPLPALPLARPTGLADPVCDPPPSEKNLGTKTSRSIRGPGSSGQPQNPPGAERRLG